MLLLWVGRHDGDDVTDEGGGVHGKVVVLLVVQCNKIRRTYRQRHRAGGMTGEVASVTLVGWEYLDLREV